MTNQPVRSLIAGVLLLGTALAAGPAAAQANLYIDCSFRIVARGKGAVFGTNKREADKVLKNVVQACTRYIKQQPRDKEKLSSAYAARGDAHDDLGEKDRAIADYDRAIEINPINGHAYFMRGKVHLDLEREAEAIDDFTDAIDLGEAIGSSHTFRGEAFLKTDQNEKAIADFSKALELDDGDSTAYLLRQRALAYIRSSQLDNAIADCTRSIAIDPKHFMGYLMRAGAYEGKGDKERAIADLKKIIEVRPDLTEADRDNIKRHVERLGGSL